MCSPPRSTAWNNATKRHEQAGVLAPCISLAAKSLAGAELGGLLATELRRS
jgi:hypothetical protein